MSCIIVNKLTKNYGSVKAVDDITMSVKSGQVFGFLGPNGAGKSTLYNLISGVYKPTSGTIKFNNKYIENLSSHEIYRLGISRSFQITNIFPNMSVFENIRCGLLWNLNYKSLSNLIIPQMGLILHLLRYH